MAALGADGLCPGPRRGPSTASRIADWAGWCLSAPQGFMQPLSLWQPLSRWVSRGVLALPRWCWGSPACTDKLQCRHFALLCRAVGHAMPGTSAAGSVRGAQPPPPTNANCFCHTFLHKIYTTIYLLIKTDLPLLPPPGIDSGSETIAAGRTAGGRQELAAPCAVPCRAMADGYPTR